MRRRFAVKGFQDLGMEPSYETEEAIELAPRWSSTAHPAGVGHQNKTSTTRSSRQQHPGVHRPGQRVRLRQALRPRLINDNALKGRGPVHPGRLLQHPQPVDPDPDPGAGRRRPDNLVGGRFVCMRRSNDISQDGSFVPSPQVGKHNDERFGTHHARDAWHLFNTMGYDLNLFSSAIKLNTQYMHTIFFDIRRSRIRRPTRRVLGGSTPTTGCR